MEYIKRLEKDEMSKNKIKRGWSRIKRGKNRDMDRMGEREYAKGK